MQCFKAVCVCVDLACELAVCSFNDGVSSLASLASSLKLNPSPVCTTFLKHKDKQRFKTSVYKASKDAKEKRRPGRRKRKQL